MLKQHALSEMKSIAESKKHHLLSYIDAKKGRTIDFSSDGFIRDSVEMIFHKEAQSDTVSRLNWHLAANKMPLDPHISQIDVVSIDGKIISSTKKAFIGHKISNYEEFSHLLNGRTGDTYFKGPHYTEDLSRIDIDIATPLIPKNGSNPIGSIVLHYDTSSLSSILNDRVEMWKSKEIYIVNRDKKMITESRFIENAILNQIVNTEPVRRTINDGYGEMSGIYPDYRGVPIVGASIDIPEYGWVLIAEVDKTEAFASILELRLYIICMVCVIVIAVSVLVVILSRRITNPIQKLVEGTKRIAKGNHDFKIVTSARDEIGCLANSFNKMSTQLGESKRLIEDYALNLKIKVADKTNEINKSKEYTENLIETAQDAFVCIDENEIINVWNKTAEKIFGYTKNEIIGKSVITILPEKYRKESQEEMKKLSDTDESKIIGKTIEMTGMTKQGNEVPIDLSLSFQSNDEGLHYFTMIIRDISERKQLEKENASLEEQLIRTQKLEAIGTMAGGIAHDFNNILTPILGYTDLAMSNILPSDKLFQDLEQVLNAAYRAKELVQQILTFSKHMEIERKPLALHLIVKEALKLLRPSIPTTINISHKIDSSCDNIFADSTQMHQVVVNLCTNAWQAMEPESGVLSIELKQVEVSAMLAKSQPYLNQSKYVCLSVTDTGIGMDKKTLERVFEPFFTTKDVDKGTGMGLSVTYGIVHSHDGEILVDSEPGIGTAFHVYLPVIKTQMKTNLVDPVEIKGGQEPILLVDDEAPIMTMLEQMLKNLGYRVDAYDNSQDALTAFQNQPDKYDLLISDLTMPNLTGVDLSEQVQKTRSGFPVIITTGYSDDCLTNESMNQLGIRQVIKKPLKMRDLALAIRNVFD